MAEKGTAQEKKAVARKTVATAKKATTKTPSKTMAKRKATKGESFVCDVCGLSVIVDEWGDVVGAQEILCCGKPMRQRTRKVKVSAK